MESLWSRAAARSLLLLVILLAGLPACQPQDDARVVTVAGTTTPNTPGEQTWLQFQRNVAAASGSTIRLRPLIYGQLGSEEQLLSGLRRGRIEYANLSAQIVSTLVPELGLLYAPYLFHDEAEADYVYDRYLTDIYRELLARVDLHLIGWYEIGFHHVYAEEPLILPADARGRRFRVSSALNARLFAQALGADVIPLGYGEIVSSLQTGLIEAGENSVSLYARTGIAGEAPHLTLTAHALGMSVIVSRKQWWDGLPPRERQILARAFPPTDATRRAIRAQTAADLAQAETLGIVVHRLTPRQRQAWREATDGVTVQLIEALGGQSRGIYSVIQQGRREFAARDHGGQVTSTALPSKRLWRRSSSASLAAASG